MSRREHSLRELQQKLAGEHTEEDLAAVLTQLVDAGLQSDRRFADVWVRHRSQQGFGPIRIRGELRQKGIASDLIQAVLDEGEMDWFDQVRSVWQRKFRGKRESDARLRARQIRFLQYRGFSGDQIRHALGTADLELSAGDDLE